MNNKTVERLEQIKFEKMEVILQILGFIESKGTLFQKDSSNLTREKIEDLLLTIGHPVKKKKNGEEEIPDTRRQINNAQNLFNRLSKTFLIEGDRSGTHFKNLRTGSTDLKGLKEDNAYQTLLVFYLSILLYKGSIYLDILSQFLELERPLDFLTSIQYYIQKKLPISFDYRSDRNNENLKVNPFVPVKIYFKDNHWFLVGWDFKSKNWNQYLFHSIKKLSPSSKRIDISKIKPFNIAEYRKYVFGSAVLNERPLHKIEIEVPASHYNAVHKRRKEGTWNKTSEPYLWTVETYDINEVFDYIFRWNGILKIKSPKEIKQQFQAKLRSFLE
ncbi:MAG: WYL domain-containing protein [Leptospiraceae bacterium]|nr:WYL domain-containing protein [Leptospiraceae bacterium]